MVRRLRFSHRRAEEAFSPTARYLPRWGWGNFASPETAAVPRRLVTLMSSVSLCCGLSVAARTLHQAARPLFQHSGPFQGSCPADAFLRCSGVSDTCPRRSLGVRCLCHAGRPRLGPYVPRDLLCGSSLRRRTTFCSFWLTWHHRWYSPCFVTGSAAGSPSHLR